MTAFSDYTLERFWGKVKQGKATQCWNWTASLAGDGYGQFGVRHGRSVRSHRMAVAAMMNDDFLLLPRAKNVLICHNCDNPLCCNPRHLYVGNKSTNAIDAINRGRLKTPFMGPERLRYRNTKLNEAVVTKIRNWSLRLSKTGKQIQNHLQKKYQIYVCESTISQAVRGLTWRSSKVQHERWRCQDCKKGNPKNGIHHYHAIKCSRCGGTNLKKMKAEKKK